MMNMAAAETPKRQIIPEMLRRIPIERAQRVLYKLALENPTKGFRGSVARKLLDFDPAQFNGALSALRKRINETPGEAQRTKPGLDLVFKTTQDGSDQIYVPTQGLLQAIHDFPQLASALSAGWDVVKDPDQLFDATLFVGRSVPSRDRSTYPRYFIYKAGPNAAEHKQVTGDWEIVFSVENIREKRSIAWGVREQLRGLDKAAVDDLIIAQRTGGKPTIVGVARVTGFKNEAPGRNRIALLPLERIDATILPLKRADPMIASIKALKGGDIATLYDISTDEATRLLAAARAAVGAPTPDYLTKGPTNETSSTLSAGDIEHDPIAYEQVERRMRRHQSKFRDALIAAYGGRCALTGVDVLEVLEAAHIEVHNIAGDNSPDNGLLLRADLHSLFDEGLLRVHPDTLVVDLAAEARTSYPELHGRKLRARVDGLLPRRTALAARWDERSR